MEKFYLYRLYQENDNLEVWIVDGSYVRSSIDADFTEGGNGQAYPDFVPENQVWIDSETSVHEWQYILLHEITEYQLMKDEGLSYEQAHEKANQAELEFRQSQPHTVEIDPAQAEAGTHENDDGGKSMNEIKVGARNNSEDQKRMQQIHDLAVMNGAQCGEGDSADTSDSEKSIDFIAFGGEIKSLGDTQEIDGHKYVEIGGYLASYGSPDKKDLEGDYFTKNTYFGAMNGDGADTYMNHCIPLKAELTEFADWVGKPIRTTRDKLGLFARTVLDLSDEFENLVYGLVQKGKLKWSSGTAGHLVKRLKDGKIERWPIVDASLTPIPAEWRETNRIMPIKSYKEMFNRWSAEGLVALAEATAPEAAREIPEDLKREAEVLKVRAGAVQTNVASR